MMKKFLTYAITAIIFLGIGILIADTKVADVARTAAKSAKTATIEVVANAADADTRTMVLAENPGLIKRIMQGGAFGGDYSMAAATNIFGRTEDAIEDVRKKTTVIEVGPRSYLIRMPIVNAAFFETDEGIVLVDTGMGPSGPAIMDAIRSVSDKPIHTIIYTHGHVDHAYGTWAIMEAGETPQIIAHDRLNDRFTRYIRLRGSLAKYMSQPLEQLPAAKDDLVWPTRTFSDRLETDDQLYV